MKPFMDINDFHLQFLFLLPLRNTVIHFRYHSRVKQTRNINRVKNYAALSTSWFSSSSLQSLKSSLQRISE